MSRHISLAVFAGLVWTGAAYAQEFRGAEVSAEILSFSEDDDLSQTTYRASAEAVVWDAFGVAADLSFYDFGDDDSVQNFTIHGLYDGFRFATVGAYYAKDSDEDASAETWGVEAERDFGSAKVEGYIGFGDVEDGDYAVLGVDGTYNLNDAFSLTGSADLLKADNGDVSRIALGGEYRLGLGPAVYAEVGRVNVDLDSNVFDQGQNYIGIGARIAIGPNRGTTFDARGFEETLSGF